MHGCYVLDVGLQCAFGERSGQALWPRARALEELDRLKKLGGSSLFDLRSDKVTTSGA